MSAAISARPRSPCPGEGSVGDCRLASAEFLRSFDIAQRHHGKLEAIACAGLRERGLQVALYRVLADAELDADVFILHPARDEESDLPFAVGEASDGAVLSAGVFHHGGEHLLR